MAADPRKPSVITPAARPSALAAPVVSNPLASALEAYDPRRFNIATPITYLDQVPPMHRVSVRIVTVNPATETYPIPGSDKVGLGKTALDKIAAAAGITWLPERSGQVDTYNSPHRVKYRAAAQIRDFDGRTRVVFAEKEVDLRGEPGWADDQLGTDAREFVRIAARKNRDAWPQIFQQRQHIHSMAESKAKLRCIRAAIGLPVAMPQAEVAKPFVVPALVPDLDTSDPEIKRMVAASLLGAQAALYGPPALPHGAQSPVLDQVEQGAPFDEPIDVSGMIEAPEDVVDAPSELSGPDPWDAPASAEPSAACTLPVSDVVLTSVTDPKRKQFIEILNGIYAALVGLIGQSQAQALAAHYAPGLNPLTAPLPEIRTLGESLRAAEKAEREARR